VNVPEGGGNVAEKDLSPDKVIASLLEGKSRPEVMTILARLEHGGAGIYHSLAKQEQNEKARSALLAAADREEQNSVLLKTMTQVKDKCEKCGKALPVSADAQCCSFQCTFCPDCATAYNHVCPNCSGQLSARINSV
jgi:membrane protease subunit (stomatin/prohibitin family)